MIDRRERKETCQAWDTVMRKADMKLLDTRIPDTKRYNKELSHTRNNIFRSTLFPPDNREIKGSGLLELLDEISRIAGLKSSSTL